MTMLLNVLYFYCHEQTTASKKLISFIHGPLAFPSPLKNPCGKKALQNSMKFRTSTVNFFCKPITIHFSYGYWNARKKNIKMIQKNLFSAWLSFTKGHDYN